MRTSAYASGLVALSILALASGATASEPEPADVYDDQSIGTTPAQVAVDPEDMPPPSPSTAPRDGHYGEYDYDYDDYDDYERDEDRYVIASDEDPPGDWAVLHGGLRPHLGTFGGIATFAIAHARTERFYGGFSLSLIRNDAGTHVGAAQLAIGRNLSDEFYGVTQLGIGENRARTFGGLGQFAVAYNRAITFVGALQLAGHNRARRFVGAAQLGAYNRTDESFGGLAQVGPFNHAREDFTGLAQVGILNAQGEMFEGRDDPDMYAAAQVGVLNWASAFRGGFQVGLSSMSDDFGGIAQIAALGAVSEEFRGLAQIGTLALANESYGMQIGAAALSLEEHAGLQMGLVANVAEDMAGAQIGLANIADEADGVQIGVFNHARRLRGLQLGLVNHAEDGVLEWSALINMGFGDGGEHRDDYYASSHRPDVRHW